MTNTLTWDIKPIALPKINSNLLSVVSLILLLTMAFMTASVIASHCGPEEKALNAALVEFGLACAALSAALLTGQWWAIGLAAGWVGKATMSVDAAQDALERCKDQHSPGASGGCNSGSCG